MLEILTDAMPQSRKLVQYLQAKGAEFNETNIMDNPQAYAYAMQIAQEGQSLPVTAVIGQVPVFGFDPEGVDRLIEADKK